MYMIYISVMTSGVSYRRVSLYPCSALPSRSFPPPSSARPRPPLTRWNESTKRFHSTISDLRVKQLPVPERRLDQIQNPLVRHSPRLLEEHKLNAETLSRKPAHAHGEKVLWC
jgi:hypothetical protein